MSVAVHDFFNRTENYLHKDFGVEIRAEILRDLIGAPAGKNILDAGCGNGSISMQFLERNEITFLDLSENMLELVRANTPPEYLTKTKRINSSLEDFHPDSKYDFVLGIGLISHVPDVKNTLAKMESLMANDGRIVIQFSNYNSWVNRLKIKLATRYQYRINKLRYEAFKVDVANAGLELVKEVQYSFLPPGMGMLPNRLLYHFTKLTYTNALLSKIGTDFIWVLKRKDSRI